MKTSVSLSPLKSPNARMKCSPLLLMSLSKTWSVMSEAKTGRNEPTINSDSTNSCLTWTHHKHQQWKIVSVGNRGADENQTYVDMNSLQTNRSDAIALGPGNSV